MTASVSDRQWLSVRGPSLLLLCLLMGGGCCAAQSPAADTEALSLWMVVGERRFTITLADSESTRAFAALLPRTLDMSEHNGNEKYARLPQALPVHAGRPGTIRKGDLMLYGADTLVVFYSTFSSPYRYTRLGRVDDPAGLAQALGRQGVQVVFSRKSIQESTL